MAINIHDPLVEIKGILLFPSPASRDLTCLFSFIESVCSFVAIFMTHFACDYGGRYWWDDAWTFFSFLKYVPTHIVHIAYLS